MPASARFARGTFRAASGVVGVLALALSSAGSALADAKQDCSEAYEATQVLRDANKLEKAIEAANVCSRDACTKFIRDDCTKWKTDLEARLASIVVEAVDASGKAETAGSVTLDGLSWLDELGGGAHVVSEGPHTLVVTVKGQPPRTVAIVVREGEKNRRVTITLPSPRPPAHGPRNFGPYLVGGVGIAVLIGGAVTGGITVHDYGVVKDQCNDISRTCSPAGRDAETRGQVLGPVTTGLLVGGGALLAAGGIWLIATRTTGKPVATSLMVVPSLSSHEKRVVLEGLW